MKNFICDNCGKEIKKFPVLEGSHEETVFNGEFKVRINLLNDLCLACCEKAIKEIFNGTMRKNILSTMRGYVIREY